MDHGLTATLCLYSSLAGHCLETCRLCPRCGKQIKAESKVSTYIEHLVIKLQLVLLDNVLDSAFPGDPDIFAIGLRLVKTKPNFSQYQLLSLLCFVYANLFYLHAYPFQGCEHEL